MAEHGRNHPDGKSVLMRGIGWPAATLGCVLVVLAINWRFLTGDAFPVFDADGQFAPWQMLIGDYARAGRLLLWNPWSSAGSPDYADPQFGAFSPLAVSFGALFGGTLDGFLAYWLFVWAFAGIGLLMLARHLKAPPWAGFIICLGFLFSGFFTGQTQHFSNIYAFAWLPWIIWRLDAAFLDGRWWPAVEAGAFWGLSALAGYPGLVLLSACYSFLWVAGRMICGSRANPLTGRQSVSTENGTNRKPVWQLLITLTVMFLVGIVVLSPTYVAFMGEGQGFSGRVEPLPRSAALEENALHPAALSTLSSPYLGMLWFYNYPKFWSYTDGSSNSIYVGVLVLCLAVWALAIAPRDAWRWWLVGMALLSIACALGRVLPLRGWLYDWLPPFRYFRHPAIFRDYAIMSITVLGLLGARDLASMLKSHDIRLRRFLWVSVGLTGVAISSFFLVLWLAPGPGRRAESAAVWCVALWTAVVLLSIFIAGLAKNRRIHLLPLSLVALAAADAFAAYDLSSISIFQASPQVRQDWQTIASEHKPDLDLTRNGWYRSFKPERGPVVANKNLPLKVPVLYSYTPFQNNFLLEWVTKSVLTTSAIGYDRVWFSTEAVETPLTSEAFALFAAQAQKLGAVPLVIHDPTAAASQLNGSLNETLDSTLRQRLEQAHAAQLPDDIRLKEYLPEALSFTVRCSADGWLLVTDRWSSGWSARVNGNPAKIWIGNFLFRAVQMRRGLNQIEFTYKAFGYPQLLILSWGTQLLIAGGTLFLFLRRRTMRRAA